MKPSESVAKVRSVAGSHAVFVSHNHNFQNTSVPAKASTIYWRVSVVSMHHAPACSAGQGATLSEATDLCIANWRAEH